jgi:hypothetical protein
MELLTSQSVLFVPVTAQTTKLPDGYQQQILELTHQPDADTPPSVFSPHHHDSAVDADRPNPHVTASKTRELVLRSHTKHSAAPHAAAVDGRIVRK